MALTLEEAKVGMSDKVDQMVVDEFRRSSLLLDQLVFDDCVSPGTGGSTLTYGYIQLSSPSTAAARKINEEYTAGVAKRTEKTTKIIPFGGSFDLDRIVIDTAGSVDEMNFQMQQKVKAASNFFTNCVVNGTAAASGTGFVPNTFDGLKKMLTGADTNIKSEVDVSTSALLDTNYNAFLDELDAFISELDGRPNMLLMNAKMLNKVRAAARRAGYYEKTVNSFGMPVETYNGIALMDGGYYYDGSNTKEIVGIEAATSSMEAKTDIYAFTIGLDALCGVSVDGSKMIKSYLPDVNQPGAVKKGEVEMLAGLALKNTRKAGVLSGIKIAPKSAGV